MIGSGGMGDVYRARDRRSGEDRRSPYPTTIGLDTGTHRQEQRQPGDRRKEPPL